MLAIVDLWRRLRRRPSATITPILVIACGVAAAVVVYAVLDHAYWKPLPFPDGETLVAIYSRPQTDPTPSIVSRDDGRGGFSGAILQELSASGAFEAVGGWLRRPAFWGFPAEDIVERWYVSSGLFKALGTKPTTGRLFTAADDTTLTDVAILSWECWQRRYAGRADILGQTILLTDAYFVGAPPRTKTVVGILPRGFRLRGLPPEVLLPTSELRTAFFFLVGKMMPERPVSAARGAVQAVLSANQSQLRSRVVPLGEDLRTDVAPPVWLLVAVAVALLAITAISVAGLSLYDVINRRQEFSVRESLGATRTSIRAQLILEQLVSCLLASFVALGIANAVLRVIRASAPAEAAISVPDGINSTALLWGLGGSLLVIAALAFPCAFVATARRGASGGSTRESQRIVLHRLTATVQLALSFVLFVCAVLLGRTVQNLTSRPIGFDAANLAVVSYRTSVSPTQALAQPLPLSDTWLHTENILAAIKAVPGVVSAAAVSAVPFGGPARSVRVGFQAMGKTGEFEAQVQNVTSTYWSTLGIRLLSGRDFQPSDRPTSVGPSARQVIVSQAIERLIGTTSVGQRLVNVENREALEIVGVVDNVKHLSFADPDLPTVYLLSGAYDGVRSIVVRTSVSPDGLLAGVKATIRSYDSSIVITDSTTVNRLMASSIWAQRFRASIGTLCGTIAIVLAAMGVLLLGLRFVELRRKEIAVRLAMGATAHDIQRLLLRDAGQIWIVSVVAAVPLALLAGYGMRGLLFGVSPVDAAVLIAAGLANATAIVVGMSRPLRRAVQINPVAALNQ